MTEIQFERELLQVFPLDQWRNRRVCLAVSGGADSVALLRATLAIAVRERVERNLFVATVDHRARGKESDDDVLFVRNLAKRLSLECNVLQIDVEELHEEARRQGSWESAARDLRYRLLEETAKRNGARFLAVAHHRDDQLETLLFRIFRGSGLDGLRGVAPYRVVDEALVIVRPLLRVTRADVLDYLRALKQDYRVDSSNASAKYARNRTRNELVPLLDSIFPGKWREALLNLSELATETERYLEFDVQKLAVAIEETRRKDATLRKLARVFDVSARDELFDGVELPLEPLDSANDVVLLRYFRRLWRERNWSQGEMGSAEWRRLVRSVRKRDSSRQFPDSIRLSFPGESYVRIEKISGR